MYNSDRKEWHTSYYGWLVTGMAFLSNMVGFGNAYAYGIFLKPLSTEFLWSRSVIAGAFSVYTLLHMIFGFLAGRLLDKFGPRAVAAVAGFFLGFTMFFMGYTTSLWQVYLSYGLFLSLGVAFSYGPLLVTVSRWFVAKRGFAVGLGTAGIGMGSLLFSPLSSWLIVSFGWRTAYLVIGVLSWIIFIPVVIFLQDAPSETWKPIDTGEKYEGFSFSLAARTRTFWLLCLATAFSTLAVWTIMAHIAPLASDCGIPPITAGFLSGLIGGASIVGKVGAGFVSDKLGRKNFFVAGMMLQLIALGWLLFSKDVWMLYVFVLLFGLGYGGWSGLLASFPADYFGLKETGTILGFILLMTGIGGSFGPYLGGYIFDRRGSYDYAVGICMIFTFAGVISAILMRPMQKQIQKWSPTG